MIKYIFKNLFLILLLFASCTSKNQLVEQGKNTAGSCVEKPEKLLALDQQAFDQTPGEGWRSIADKEGCKLAAADLIREYRERAVEQESDQGRITDPGRFDILFWHEGQLRAIAGMTEEAIPLFRRGFSDHSSPSWIYYAEATIAFLERNREGIETARDSLLQLKPPSDWDEQVRKIKEQHGFEMVWPPNLNIVEGFLHCFDKPYDEAYGNDCS